MFDHLRASLQQAIGETLTRSPERVEDWVNRWMLQLALAVTVLMPLVWVLQWWHLGRPVWTEGGLGWLALAVAWAGWIAWPAARLLGSGERSAWQRSPQ